MRAIASKKNCSGNKSEQPNRVPFSAQKQSWKAPLWAHSPLPLQASLKVNSPNDKYEQEADRVASQVMRMPENAVSGKRCACGKPMGPDGMCADCKRKQLGIQRQTSVAGAETAVSPTVQKTLSQSGHPLDHATRNFMESRFGRDFGQVRVHTGAGVSQAADELNANAFTHKQNIFFNQGRYQPETVQGQRLLAHELTHTIQQGSAPIKGSVAANESKTAVSIRNNAPHATNTIARDWIIRNPTHTVTSGGTTDATYITDAFQDICPLMSLSGNNRLIMGQGPPSPNRTEGCTCLQDIENDLASPSPILSGTPEVELAVQGWSSTNPASSPPIVSARHPESSFDWGYWTGGQTRHVKPFWQTVAHEVCGHVVTWVRTRGAHAGGRRSTTGHNEAIIGENKVAAEHGVSQGQQRGLDVDPQTGQPLAGHRGESFLQANVLGFGHGAHTLPSSATGVVNDAVATILATGARGLDLFVQVEGWAYSNEGGLTLAQQRAENMRLALETEFQNQNISLSIAQNQTSIPRFTTNQTRLVPGQSQPQTSDLNRRVQVYLFHKPHSAGP